MDKNSLVNNESLWRSLAMLVKEVHSSTKLVENMSNSVECKDNTTIIGL